MKTQLLHNTRSLLFSFLLTLVSVAGWGQTYTMNNSSNLPDGWAKTTRSAFQTYASQSQLQLFGPNGGVEGEVFTTFTFTNVSGISFNGTGSNNVTLTGFYSTDNTNWISFGTVSIAKNSSSNSDYSFSDVSDLSGKTVYLKFRTSASSAYLKTITITTTSTVDTTPPTLSSTTPADDATNVAIDTNLNMTFNENVKKGTGNIYIKRSSDDANIQTIDVTSTDVSVSNATVTVKPPSDLANSTAYYIQLGSGVIQDTAGNNYAGISDVTSWNFTTAALAAPVISSSLTKSTQYGAADTYTITASGAISYSTGTLPAGFTLSGNTISKANNVDAGTYNISISATNAGGTDTKTLVWTVTKKEVTVSITASDKVYDAATSASLGTPTIGGVLFGDDVSPAGTVTGVFADKNVGIGKTVTLSGLGLSGAKAGNYSLPASITTTASISKKPLSIAAPTIASKVYNGSNATGTITVGTLSGFVSIETVTVTATGTYPDANAGTGKTATVTYFLANGANGGLATNYSVASGTGTGDITKADPVFTTSAISVTTGATYSLPGANISSTSDGAYSFSMTDNVAATLTNGNTINGIAVGTNSVTVNQAASTNYNAKSTTVSVNVVSFNNGDYMSASDGTWKSGGSGTATWKIFDGSTWVSVAAGSEPSTSTTKNVYIWNQIKLQGTFSASNIIIENGGQLDTNLITPTFTNILVKSGGTFLQNGYAKINTGGNLEVLDGGVFNFFCKNKSPRSSTIWNGSEKFHPNSTLKITNADTSGKYYLFENNSDIDTYTDPTTGYSACFGNVVVDNASGSALQILPVSFTKNFAHHNVTFITNSSDKVFCPENCTTGIGGNLIYDEGYNQNFTFLSSSNVANIIIKGNLLNNSSKTIRLVNDASGGTTNLTVEGNINLTSTGGMDLNLVSGGTGNLDLKGNLIVGTSATLRATYGSTATFNFTGTTGTQTIDVSNASTTSNIAFSINTGAYAKLINQNLALGANSTFTVNNGGALDFGFKSDNTALNLLTGSGTGQKFELKAGGTLKITSPDGITATANLGNIQTPVAGRTYNPAGIYHYIGKANQSTGNGLPGGTESAGTNIKVIADLDDSNPLWPYDDRLTLTINGMVNLNDAGELEIRRGTVLDSPSNGFSDASSQNAKLTMNNGRYKIYRTSGTTQPALGGAYTLNGGVIEFAGNGKFNIRTNKDYLNVEVTGIDVTAGTTDTAGIRFLPNGTFKVMNGGVFKVNNPDGFSGSSSTAIRNDKTPEITLEDGSTVEYSSGVNQVITEFKTLLADLSNVNTGGYYNLKISGNDGTAAPQKTIDGANVYVRNNLAVSTELIDNAKLVVNADKTLTVKNIITSKAPDNLLVESGGNLVQINDGAENVGGIKVYRGITFSNLRKEYNFYSSPVKGQNMKELFGVSGNTPFAQVLDEANNVFKLATDLDYEKVGKGFAVKDPNSSYTVTRAEFKGVPNNGIHDVEVTRAATPTNRGWNLIGNPYPSNIDAKLLYEASTNIDRDFRFWDNTVNATYTYNGSYGQYSYAILNASTGVGTPAPGLDPTSTPTPIGTKAPDRYISVGQGFIVKALTPAGGTVKFSNAKRTATKPGNVYFGKNATADYDRFRIQLKTPKGIVLTNTIAYDESWSNDFGNDDSRHPGLSSFDLLYNMVGEEKVVINGRSGFTNEDVIPLGYKAYERGSYLIRLRDQAGLFANNGQVIYLKDKQTGITADLSQGEYEFTTEAGEFTNRFEIVYQPDAVLTTSANTPSPIEVYRDGGDFVVYSFGKKINRIEVYDASGRLILMQGTNSQEIRMSSQKISSGLYFVKVVLPDGSEFVKKFRR